MADLLEIDSHRPAHPVRPSPAMEQVTTPLDWRAWDKALMEHPDPSFQKYIIERIMDSFKTGFDYIVKVQSSPANMASAMEHRTLSAIIWRRSVVKAESLALSMPKHFHTYTLAGLGFFPRGHLRQTSSVSLWTCPLQKGQVLTMA